MNGTAYSIKKGRTLIGGTGYDIIIDAKPTKITMSGFGNVETYGNSININGTKYTSNGDYDFQSGINVYLQLSSDDGILVNGEVAGYQYEENVTGKTVKLTPAFGLFGIKAEIQ